MKGALEQRLEGWIETFAPLRELDLLPLWRRADGSQALNHPWGQRHRPDWAARGLVIWPRGGQTLRLSHRLGCPPHWRGGRARLALRWWAEAAELWVDGQRVHQGDLFDAACRWPLPERFWGGAPLELELRLRSPKHDDGGLTLARLEREPLERSDPDGLLLLGLLRLLQERLPQLQQALKAAEPSALAMATALQAEPSPDALPALRQALAALPSPGHLQLISHAHLDLAWLWPVADTWQAAERTFRSVLQLMAEDPALGFGHSTPALYHWLEQHRPALFAQIQAASRAGRWEPLNGPWVESDCTLGGTASLLRQFEAGQAYSQSRFPEWNHQLAWLPDSFGFSGGLPAICAATGVRWFLTHKLFWNATNPFPHRLFRWRHPSGAELLALMTAPIGTDGDPIAMARHLQQWQGATGLSEGLWLPGVGDHGGGPSREMLAQLQLWNGQPLCPSHQFGSLREFLGRLEPLAAQLPIWRDELYLELHRGCATSRPDQKRHNRSLERLLREADLAEALLGAAPAAGGEAAAGEEEWRCLLFQQFHDILPGTSIPEVFEQAESSWRTARRRSRQRRDRALAALAPGPAKGGDGSPRHWWVGQLWPAPAATAMGERVLRLPAPAPGHQWQGPLGPLPWQPCPSGGQWVQLPIGSGVELQRLGQEPGPGQGPGPGGDNSPAALAQPVQPVQLTDLGQGQLLLENSRLRAWLGPQGLEQLQGNQNGRWGPELLAAPLGWGRFSDRGEFWDAWDLAANYPEQPLPFQWARGPELLEQGPLCTRLRWQGLCGQSPISLVISLQAASEILELTLQTQWRQCHELLRCHVPLAQPGGFWAADCAAGVQERPSQPRTPREASRWECPALSWLAGGTAAAGLALLLDGPQGVNGSATGLGVSLLRGPTWPDPSADQGLQRLRLGLMAAPGGWCQALVPAAAAAFRQPPWQRPAAPGPCDRQELLPWPDPHLQLLALEKTELPGSLVLKAQNLSPRRGHWPGPTKPWELGRWSLERPAPAAFQSS